MQEQDHNRRGGREALRLVGFITHINCGLMQEVVEEAEELAALENDIVSLPILTAG